MAKAARVRLGVDTPLIREFPISAVQNFDDRETGKNVSVCKYLKPYNEGTKDEPKWVDRVYKEWVENPQKINLLGAKIRVETSIVE